MQEKYHKIEITKSLPMQFKFLKLVELQNQKKTCTEFCEKYGSEMLVLCFYKSNSKIINLTYGG